MPALASAPVSKALVKVTSLSRVSMVAVTPSTIVNLLEMSCILPVSHCRHASPVMATVPVVPSAPLAKASVPALRVVPPV